MYTENKASLLYSTIYIISICHLKQLHKLIRKRVQFTGSSWLTQMVTFYNRKDIERKRKVTLAWGCSEIPLEMSSEDAG